MKVDITIDGNHEVIIGRRSRDVDARITSYRGRVITVINRGDRAITVGGEGLLIRSDELVMIRPGGHFVFAKPLK